MSRFRFFDEENSATPGKAESDNDLNPEASPFDNTCTFDTGAAKYRSEQLVVIKVDGIIENHAETKLEYTIDKVISNGQLLVKVALTDQIVNMQPAHLQESFELMSKVDVIKSNAVIKIDPKNGKINDIINLAEINANWLTFKKQVEENTSFIKSADMKESINLYLNNTGLQFTKDNLMQDFQVRPFFDLFFSAYLITHNFSVRDETRLYYSQLFDRLPIELDTVAKIINESPDLITVTKDATLNRKNLNLALFEKIYDERYKPRIGYKFNQYNFEHHTQVTYNLKDNLLEDALMNITETVEHNIEVFVDYKIRRVL